MALVLGPSGPRSRFASQVEERRIEFDALVRLMMDTTPDERPETIAVAEALAAGCLGEQHLWRDMGLPDRPTLRDLLLAHFPALAEKNDRDMRWKKFLYKCLCRWEGFHVCRAPSCDLCWSRPECFGPED